MSDQHPRIYHKTTTLCDFVRFDLTGCERLELKKIFHDHISIIGFSNSVWSSRQNGRDYVEKSGDIIIRDAGQVFSATMEQTLAPEVMCREMHISHKQLDHMVLLAEGELKHIDFTSPVLSHPDLHRFLWHMHGTAEAGFDDLETSSHFCYLLQRLSHASRRDTPSLKSYYLPRTVQLAVTYIREHYARNINLLELANHAGANPFVLLRHFRKELGVTPHEYLNICRLNRARSMLKNGLSIANVAHDCGYVDQSHMTRCFKKHLGITPGRYVSQM